jgi:hypothetical protein
MASSPEKIKSPEKQPLFTAAPPQFHMRSDAMNANANRQYKDSVFSLFFSGREKTVGNL